MDFQDGLHICPISRLSFLCSVFKVRSLNFVKFRFQYLMFQILKSTFNSRRVLEFQFLLRLIANCLPLSKAVVGQSGLEPPTSRLSVVCSNQLSYWPIFGGD